MENDIQELILKDISGTYQQIRGVLRQARSRVLQVANAGMVACYWQIGRLIIKEEQPGETRAAYGKGLIKELHKDLPMSSDGDSSSATSGLCEIFT